MCLQWLVQFNHFFYYYIMSGGEFCLTLERLGILSAGELCGSDIDWVFTGEDMAPLTAFCSWFCSNVNCSDVLTQEELDQWVISLQL